MAVSNGGERVAVDNSWLYWAHLSIYQFAVPSCAGGRRVLDAGSGAGYGAAFLVRHGASVVAYEADADAVSYAREKYAGCGVSYEVVDLNDPLPAADRQFDVVFSSNVFEHVPNVDGLAAECARVVKHDGALIVAVPPVTWSGSAESDIRNHFHVHHIPPAAWHAKLSRFFVEVECYIHHGRGKWRAHELMVAEHARPAHEVTMRETDFEFTRIPVDQFVVQPSITALFVCRQPRDVALPETLAERMPAEWHTGAIVAKILREERQACEDRVRQAAITDPRLAALLNSTSWRITRPLRRVVRALRGR
jgi:2-polyprenyl-3-methyl-5-hydroxy-6-metoxy-1,4-benzoquinol methylase